MSAQDWVLLLLIVVLYCAFAGWLARFSVTMPMVLVLAGALTGPDVLGLIDIPATAAGVERVAEVTLALLLFADAATLDLGRMRHHAGLTGRLLLIGLPLTVLLGAVLAFALFPNEGLGFALLIAAILAPSDAALALPTSGSSRVPVRILRTLRIESGLNDGIAAPLVALFVAFTIEEQQTRQSGWLFNALSDIGLALVVGVVVGFVGGKLFSAAVVNHGQRLPRSVSAIWRWPWESIGPRSALAPTASLPPFSADSPSLPQLAPRCIGLRNSPKRPRTILSTLIWTVFGASLVVPLLRAADARAVIFAILALTLVRMVPVAISMIGTGLRPDTVLVMGFLGPRGLPSVILMLIAYEALHEVEHHEANTLTTVVGWAITLSVLLHALTGDVLTRWYARRLETAPPDAPELLPSPDLSAAQSSAHG